MQLEVSNGVGCHHELKAEEARDEFFLNVFRGEKAFVSRFLKTIIDVKDDLREEGGRACGGIEDFYGVIGESVFFVEDGDENFIHGTDDVGDEGLGCVVNAALLAQFGIVGGEEGFVEMDDGVFALDEGFRVRTDGDVGRSLEQSGDVIGDPADVGREVFGCDLLEELGEEGIGCRDELGGVEAIEFFLRYGIVLDRAAGGKETIGHGLGVEVSEFIVREIRQQLGLKGSF